MRKSPLIVSVALATLWLLVPNPAALNNGVSNGNQQPSKTQGQSSLRGAAPGAAVPADAARSQELVEREAALNLKEQEMKKVSEGLDAKIKELNDAKKSIESTLAAKKKIDDVRYKKMMKLYKSMRPEEAAKLLDKLDEDIVFEMLNQMDQKTAAKLIPYLNQSRVLKWTRLTLKK